MNRKKIIGIILSYLLIAVDTLVGIFFVPFLLKKMGDSDYGLYKLLVSTASYLSILDFGIGGTMTRYIIKYRTSKDEIGEVNFMAMGFVIYGILSAIVIAIASFIVVLIPYLYQNSINTNEVSYARLVFAFICGTTVISLFNHAYNGILHAYERFTFSKISNIIKIVLRISLIACLFLFEQSALIVVVVDFGLALLMLFSNYIYVKFAIKKKIHLFKFDKRIAKEAFIFTFAILIQSIINQFNSNLDNIALGVFTTTSTVAMYSLVLQIYNMYENLSTAVSTVYLPSIAESVFRGETNEEITMKIVEPSRIQLMILLLALTGFVAFGRSFVVLWVGEGYDNVYYLCAILLLSSTLELSQSTITSVLKAKNKLMGKTIILISSTVLNAILTFSLVPVLGPFGAVVGTSSSLVFGYGIGLNIYYHKVVKLDMFLYFKKTISDIWIPLILFIPISVIFSVFVEVSTWWLFILLVLFYVICFVILMFLFGMNRQEKTKIRIILKKIFSRRKKI